MSTLEADLSFDFTFPLPSSYEDPSVTPFDYSYGSFEHIYDPCTPPNFTFDPSLLELSYNPTHTRSSSQSSSSYSVLSSVESSPDSSCSRMTTPPPIPLSCPPADFTPPVDYTLPAYSPPVGYLPPVDFTAPIDLTSVDLAPPPVDFTPPVRQHGPILLPKIRSQDQAIEATLPAAKRVKRTSTPPVAKKTPLSRAGLRASHVRSATNPESISAFAAGLTFGAHVDDSSLSASASIAASPVSYTQEPIHYFHERRSSSPGVHNANAGTGTGVVNFPAFSQMPQAAYVQATPRTSTNPFIFPSAYTNGPMPVVSRASPALRMSTTPEPVPHTNLATYLTAANPAPSLVRSISFHHRDPHTKHFWWDVRQVRTWSDFTARTILSLDGAAAALSCPIPASMLATPAPAHRHPETEASLHRIYASHYLPRLNSVLAVSSANPLQLSVPTKTAPGAPDNLFVATVADEPATAAAIFGGRPSARIVGMVRSYHRFNTTMRTDGNIKRVEYLRGLAALHQAMREHGCRYGFVLTEIELVVVRNGTEPVPFFGRLEVVSVPLNVAVPTDLDLSAAAHAPDLDAVPLTACLALWGLCMMAGDEPAAGQAYWRSEIGAPAEGTRRKAVPRDAWMPQPQLAEKRESKRARGWVMPEDAIGRKELGKRGVKYGRC